MQTHAVIQQFSRMLANLDAWLAAGAAHAKQKEFEPDVLARARLAPDQFDLVQQVQSACDSAKFAAAYLSGQQAPRHPDQEKTLAELRERVKKARAFVDGLAAADFKDAETRRVAPPWMEGKSLPGDVYLLRLAQPNFYFHVTTAYAILRHNGVPLGKLDYMGASSWTAWAQ